MAIGAPTSPACPSCSNAAWRLRFHRQGWDFVRCSRCGLLRLDPIPTEAELAADYAKRFESGNYEPSKAAERLPTLEGIFEVVKENAPDGARNLFDVGCFDGGLMDLATQSGLGTWGLEFQGPAAELAAKRHPGRIKTGALEGLDPPDGIVFDVVTAIGLIEHLREPETLLAFARKALRPGGILVVQTPNARSIPARTLGRYWPCSRPPSTSSTSTIEH